MNKKCLSHKKIIIKINSLSMAVPKKVLLCQNNVFIEISGEKKAYLTVVKI